MTDNDLCKILCFTPLKIRIELRNVRGKLTFYFKFLNNWDIRRRKAMTRKIFIDKTKEFKKPSINTNQYDFFFLLFLLFLFLFLVLHFRILGPSIERV